MLQVPEGASGCIVVKLEPSTEAAQHLQLADVILEVEGTPIAADESVQFRDDERVDYSHVISLKHVGDTLNLKILRNGEVRRLLVCSFVVVGSCAHVLPVVVFVCTWLETRCGSSDEGFMFAADASC
jgi:hypothetical protein